MKRGKGKGSKNVKVKSKYASYTPGFDASGKHHGKLPLLHAVLEVTKVLSLNA